MVTESARQIPRESEGYLKADKIEGVGRLEGRNDGLGRAAGWDEDEG